MKAAVFDLMGSLAHFRRPDTTATHLSYPFITPTAVKGLVGAVLGRDDFVTRDRVAIQLLKPVATVAQRMSLLGKDGGTVFNRPTTIELVVNPAYRIYYVGDEYAEELGDMLGQGRSVYPTYLGAAFCLTKPVLRAFRDDVALLRPAASDVWRTPAVLPVSAVEDLTMEPDRQYSRAGGYMRRYAGARTFEGSVSYLYERQGRPIVFQPAVLPDDSLFGWAEWEGDAICLV